MYLRRHYNLLSCSEIMPKMDNFSDSIILSTKIYSGEKKYNQVNSLIFDIFSQLCRTLIAVGLRMGIALRGFIKIGEYFNDVASSVEFKSVSRWGEGRNVEIFKAMWQEAGLVFPQEEKPKNNEQLPQIRIPVHFGDALTKAYLSESKIKNIGIFMSKDVSDKYYIKKQVEEENILAINKGEYFALNWCREVHYDVYMEIMKYIESCLLEHKDSEYVLEKWKNLYSYAKYAPTK